MFICAAAFAAALTSCKKDGGDALKGIEFDEDEITLAVGEEYDLSEILSAVPANAELPKCAYSSDDKTVATVGKSTGNVKAVAAGEATVTATVVGDDRKTADITVTVKSSNPNPDPAAFTVTGAIWSGSAVAAWPSVSASFDGGVSYAVTAPITNRQFSIALPAPATGLLRPLIDEFESGLTVSPANAKFCDVEFYARNGAQRSYIYSGSATAGIECEYVYADMDVSINGTYTDTFGGITDIEVYNNLQLKKGWNVCLDAWDNSTAIHYYSTGPVPADAVWICGDDYFDFEGASSLAAGGRKTGRAGVFKHYGVRKI
jgi:hypothetical protein